MKIFGMTTKRIIAVFLFAFLAMVFTNSSPPTDTVIASTKKSVSKAKPNISAPISATVVAVEPIVLHTVQYAPRITPTVARETVRDPVAVSAGYRTVADKPPLERSTVVNKSPFQPSS